MKPRPPLLSSALGLLVVLGFAACANRGMYTVTGDGGGTGGAGEGGSSDGGATGGKGGSGGAGGTVCVPGSGSDAGACTSTFNFENCALYGTTLDPSQPAFKAIANVRSPTQCGQGAMEISAEFAASLFLPDGAVNPASAGSMSMPFSGDLRGKTVTIHVMATPATTSLTTFYFYPLTSKGAYDANILKTSPIFGGPPWTTKSYTFPMDADGSLGLANVFAFLIQGHSNDGYVGKIYIDEIDISAGPPDGGATDAPSTDAPGTDAPGTDAPMDAGSPDGPRDATGN